MIGGTGTLGHAVAPLLSHCNVTVLSRDEFKQKKMMQEYPQFGYVIGDVRDVSTFPAKKFHIVFHFAALKHIDVCEDNVTECIKTNVLGTENVRNFCHTMGVKYAVLSSTDKAVLPINTYGFSKALAEKVFFEANTGETPTRFSVFRWGNVIGSRGSVVPIFKESLLKDKLVKITHPAMTRFWITSNDAAKYIVHNYKQASKVDAMIPNMKASLVSDVALTIADILGIEDYETDTIGIRPGEKIHECLRSTHNFCLRSDNCPIYSIKELTELVRPYI